MKMVDGENHAKVVWRNYDTETPAIRKGISYLLANPYVNEKYPTGTGLPGGFYIRYHSYAQIYPLLTLAHYTKKYRK